jgi:hypothetical protein
MISIRFSSLLSSLLYCRLHRSWESTIVLSGYQGMDITGCGAATVEGKERASIKGDFNPDQLKSGKCKYRLTLA